MKNTKVVTKLTIGFVIILVATVFSITLGLIGEINNVKEGLENKARIVDPLNEMVKFSIAYGNVRSATRDIGRATEEDATERHITTLTNNMKICIDEFNDYLSIFGDDEHNTEEYIKVKATRDALVAYGKVCQDKLVPAGRANNAEEVFRIITEELAPYGTIIRENVDFLVNLKAEQTEEED